MFTGWKKIGNDWYYFQHNGVMATSQITIEGRGYIFGSDGVCTNPY
jgi:glucan-binding YG repeat protein